MSVIARTAGIGRSLEELQWDLNYLLQLWQAIDGAAQSQSGAFLIYQESSLSGMSVTGQMGGTLAYIPPEQITHFREARPQADIYAIGATLYTLLTGRTIFPFLGRPEQQVARILFDAPVPVQSHRPEVPDGLAAIIHKALAKAPADRFADANAIKDAMAPFAKLR